MQALNAGPVVTNIWTVEAGQWLKPNAETYVASALKTIGFGRHTSGYYPHALLQLGARLGNFFLPYVYDKIVWYNHRQIKPQ